MIVREKIQLRSSTLGQLVCTQNIINSTLTTLTVVKNQHTQQTQTPNTDGRSYSLKGYTLLIIVIMICMSVLVDITTSSGLREPGTGAVKSPQQQSVVK